MSFFLAPLPASISPQLVLHFERASTGGTFLSRQFVTYPFFLTKPFYLDERLPGMPSLILQSISGGIYQDECIVASLAAGNGAQVHCTTQSATVVHSMAENQEAYQEVHITAGEGGLVEYLPGPLILFPQARLRTTLNVVVDPKATVIFSDAFFVHDPTSQKQIIGSFMSETSIRRPDGQLLCRDRFRITGDDHTLSAPGVLHHCQAQGTFWVLSSSLSAGLLEAVRRALSEVSGLYAGVSTLPNSAGVWARFLASDALALSKGFSQVWAAVRQVLTGRGLEGRRRVGWL